MMKHDETNGAWGQPHPAPQRAGTDTDSGRAIGPGNAGGGREPWQALPVEVGPTASTTGSGEGSGTPAAMAQGPCPPGSIPPGHSAWASTAGAWVPGPQQGVAPCGPVPWAVVATGRLGGGLDGGCPIPVGAPPQQHHFLSGKPGSHPASSSPTGASRGQPVLQPEARTGSWQNGGSVWQPAASQQWERQVTTLSNCQCGSAPHGFLKPFSLLANVRAFSFSIAPGQVGPTALGPLGTHTSPFASQCSSGISFLDARYHTFVCAMGRKRWRPGDSDFLLW